MAEEELLSKEEIDALLTGVEEGEVDTSPRQAAGEVRLYDFSSQEHIVRGRMPTLEMINERFVRYARQSMFNFLRQSVEVRAQPIETLKFSEYLAGLALPASMNLVRIKPLRGAALFVFNAEMVFKLVDRFFGSGKSAAKILERDFTPTEQRVIHKILQQVFNDLREAWKSVMAVEFELVGAESNPAMMTAINASEVMVLSSFEFQFDETQGLLQLAIPYSALEPVRDTLDAGVQADVQESDQHWASVLRDDLMQVNLPLGCVVAERKIRLRDILSFKPGDIIPIEMPETSRVYANGVPLFDAKLGALRDHLALKIVRQLKR